jgi:hypothetical protein
MIVQLQVSTFGGSLEVGPKQKKNHKNTEKQIHTVHE